MLGLASSMVLIGTAAADVTLDVGDFSIGGGDSGQPTQFVYTVDLAPGLDVIGMTFDAGGFYTINHLALGGDQFGFGSDMVISVTDPGGGTTTFGGAMSSTNNPWNNFGPEWTGLETWEDAFDPGVSVGGEWTFTFIYDFPDGGEWGLGYTDVVITLHQVPAPGAFALLGLAGLSVRRRRRI